MPSGQDTAVVLCILLGGVLLGGVLLGLFVPSVAGAPSSGPSGQALVVDDDGEDCPGAEFRTIQAALDEAAPGETVQVCAGNYTENVVVTTPDLTLEGRPQAILYDTEPQSYGDCWSNYEGPKYTGFQISASNVTVRGFDISNYMVGIYVTNAKHADLRNNDIAPRPHEERKICSTAAFFLENASSTTVRNNTVSGGSGVQIRNATETLVENNTFTETVFYSFRIQDSPRTVVRNNDMATGRSTVIDVRTSDRLRITGNVLSSGTEIRSSNQSVIRGNTIEDGDIRLVGPNTTDTRIHDNILHDGGILVDTSHALIRNNSVGVTNPDGEYWGSDRGIAVFGTADHSVISGNTVHQQPEAGIYASATDNVTISSNSVTASRFGVIVKGNATGDVAGNTIARNTDGIVVCGGIDDCDMSRRRQPSVNVRNNDIRSNLNAGIRIWNNVDTSRMLITNNRFRDNGNFTIMNDGKGDLNTEENAGGTVTPTAAETPHDSVTEKPQPGYGVLTGIIGIIVTLGLLVRRRRENLETRDR